MIYEVQAGSYLVVAATPRMVAQKLVDPFYSGMFARKNNNQSYFV